MVSTSTHSQWQNTLVEKYLVTGPKQDSSATEVCNFLGFYAQKVMAFDLHDVCIPAPVPNPAAPGQRALTCKLPGFFL